MEFVVEEGALGQVVLRVHHHSTNTPLICHQQKASKIAPVHVMKAYEVEA